MSVSKFPVIFIDGASCSGKSTIKSKLIDDHQIDLGYAKRHTTRQKRPDDDASGDYIFISEDEYQKMQHEKRFIESKEFKFGMSYGIGWEELSASLGGHDGVIAMINLGNVDQAKSSIPWALSILVDAPIDSILSRLHNRGLNTDEQIEERVNSAKSVAQLRSNYDYVCFNEDGKLEFIYNDLKEIIAQYLSEFDGDDQ